MKQRKRWNEPPLYLPSSAAGWLVRTRLRDLTPEEQQALFEWVRQSEKNRKEYIRAATIWLMVGGLVRYPEVRNQLSQLQAKPPSNVTPLLVRG